MIDGITTLQSRDIEYCLVNLSELDYTTSISVHWSSDRLHAPGWLVTKPCLGLPGCQSCAFITVNA